MLLFYNYFALSVLLLFDGSAIGKCHCIECDGRAIIPTVFACNCISYLPVCYHASMYQSTTDYKQCMDKIKNNLLA